MRHLIVALFFCVMLAIPAQAQNEETATAVAEYLQLADSLISAEDAGDRARLLYQQALSLDGNNAMIYHKIAQSFVGDYAKERADRLLDSVITYENKARLSDPKFRDAYDWEVAAYRAKWRHGRTRKVLLEALEHLPNDPEILMLTGRNYFDTGNPGLALPYLEKAIEVGGEEAPGVAYRFAGWCWFYLEQHHKQLEYFNQFREINPQSLMGIAGQVHSYTGLKNYDKATELAIQIKEENPDYDYPAYLEAYIGETLLFGENFEQAIPYYEKAMALDSTSQNLFATRAVTTTLGYLYLQREQTQKGIKLLNQTIIRRMQEWREMPERWEFSFDIASAYAAMGELDEAYQWLYTSVLTGYPGHLWKSDPLFSRCHSNFAFSELVKRARIRVESEYQE
jgi:tetratricopeptide (TPR) repeat protein